MTVLAIALCSSATALPTHDWRAEANVANARFGSGAVIVGDVNGDGYDDIAGAAYQYGSSQGAVAAWHGGPAGPAASPAWQVVGTEVSGYLGRTLARAGDVNGDGYDDVLVGADRSATWSNGEVSLYLGSPSGLEPVPAWTFGTATAGASSLGSAAAGAGDVNGDGYDDIIVGDSSYDAGPGSRHGAAVVFLGSASGPSVSWDWGLVGGASDSSFGGAVSTAGDVNGDGFDDVMVGAWQTNGNRGAVYVYLGSASGLATMPVWTDNGSFPYNYVGDVVGPGGDVNADGYADILYGSSGYFRISLGSASGPLPATEILGPFAYSYGTFGSALSTAGDVDGDGFDDVVTGDSYYGSSGAHEFEGAVFLFRGGPSGLSTSYAVDVQGNESFIYLGDSVGGGGDVNGDGFDDVVAGAPYFYRGQYSEGAIFLFLGH